MPGSPTEDEYQAARAKARRRPTWWLRRRDVLISSRSRPSGIELAELVAVRAELKIRAIRRAPTRWWVL